MLRRAEEIRPQDLAMMLTTSGTTAKPKLSMLSHENLIFASQSYGKVVPMNRGDELLSAAPLAWIGEQLYNVTRFITVGGHYNFPEETETLRKDLLELQPFYFGGTPVVWELIISTIQAAMDNADFFKRYFYDLAIRSALKCTEAELAGEKAPVRSRLLHRLLHFLGHSPPAKPGGPGTRKDGHHRRRRHLPGGLQVLQGAGFGSCVRSLGNRSAQASPRPTGAMMCGPRPWGSPSRMWRSRSPKRGRSWSGEKHPSGLL